jgi:hypothetical protein
LRYTFHDPSLAALARVAEKNDAQMAAFEVTTSQWDQLLQENYVIKDIVDAINKATVFKDKLKRKRTSSGRRDIYPVMLGVHQGVGARGENAKLPAAGRGQYEDAIVTTKYNYAQLYITGQAKEFSTRKAFVDFAVRILKDTKEGLSLDLARQSWGDGSGTIALVNNAGFNAGQATTPVNSAYGVLWGSVATNTTFLFKKNMTIAFGAEDNAGQGYAITSITGTAINFAPPLLNNVANGAKITRLGAAGVEIEGWLKLVATNAFMQTVLGMANGVYHNIDRSVYSDWEGSVTDFGAAALSFANIRNLKDKLFRRGGVADVCIAGPEILRDFEALLTTIARIVPATKLAYGATALEHDGLKWTKDKDAPVMALHLTNSSEIEWAQRMEPTWKKQGDSIFRVVSGYDAEEATLMWYSNLDAPTPRNQAMGYNILTT